MSGALSANSRLQLVAPAHSPVAARRQATALPLQADWTRVLTDITTLGFLNVEVANTAATLRVSAEPWVARIKGGAASVSGPGLRLAGLTERWALASIARGTESQRYEHLDIYDHLGDRLMRLSLTEDSNWSGFKSLLVRQWAKRTVPVMLPDRESLPKALEGLETHVDMVLSGRLADEWFDADRRYFAGQAVDPSLLGPFFETLSDQVCPLQIRLGNPGLLFESEAAYFDYRQMGDLLRLRSTTTTLEIELQKLAAARIVTASDQRWLRLYDEQCRCVLIAGLSTQAEHGDEALWQCMLRALRE